MNIKRSVFFCLLFVMIASVSADAQKKLKKGSVSYQITEFSGDALGEAGEMVEEMMKGSEYQFYFNKKEQMTKVTMMGGMIQMKIFNNQDGNEIFMDMMGQKYRVPVSQEMKEEIGEEAKDQNVVFDKIKDEKRNILGYPCKKLSLDLGGNGEMDMWVTSKIIASAPSLSNQLPITKIDGFPLEMNLSSNGIQMTFKAKEISSKISKSVFERPSGYEEKSIEELQNLGGMPGLGI